jgi:hypothetical protein
MEIKNPVENWTDEQKEEWDVACEDGFVTSEQLAKLCQVILTEEPEEMIWIYWDKDTYHVYMADSEECGNWDYVININLSEADKIGVSVKAWQKAWDEGRLDKWRQEG